MSDDSGATPPPDYTPPPPPVTLWGWFERGWRPAIGYALCATIVARAIVIPVGQFLRRAPIDPVDWPSLIALATALAIARSYDKSKGTA